MKIVASEKNRQFTIYGRLIGRPGDENQVVYMADVGNLHRQWQVERNRVLPLLIYRADFSSGRHFGNQVVCDSRIAWVMSGSINGLFTASQSDDNARETLIDLATYVADGLGLDRVCLTFLGEDFIIEYEKQAASTGD